MLSVITPVLNGKEFIENNIRSVQSLSIPFEHIVVDGGSADGTREKVQQYSHVKILNQEKKDGMYGAINQGLQVAKGRFTCYLNCDDVFLPGIVELYNKAEQSAADLIYGDAYFHFADSGKKVLVKGNRFGTFFLKAGILPFVQSSSIFSRKSALEIGGFRSELFRISGDLDFFQRLALKGSKIIYHPTTASLFLKYGNSLGDLNTDKYLQERRLLMCGNTPSIFDKALFKASGLLS